MASFTPRRLPGRERQESWCQVLPVWTDSLIPRPLSCGKRERMSGAKWQTHIMWAGLQILLGLSTLIKAVCLCLYAVSTRMIYYIEAILMETIEGYSHYNLVVVQFVSN